MQLLPLFQNHEIVKAHKSGQNRHFYMSIKQLGTIMNSLSGRLLKNAIVEF